MASRRLPNTANRSTRDFHSQANEIEKDEIIEVEEQDPSNVLLHPTEAGDPYYIGDIYDEQPLDIAREWAIDTSKNPYLLHIKSLSRAWPHLQYLADFMEVGTTPLRWKFLSGKPMERRERAMRTNVARLDFLANGQVTRTNFTTAMDLEDGLTKLNLETDSKDVQFRLFVVEDLSRRVIEALGSKFDIDPAFFREHINDYAWYNVRDRFMDPPNIDIVAERQDWFQVRWVRTRYFRTRASFEKARLESNRFNVFRRPDEDLNNRGLLDDKEATVALTRTRASFWKNKGDGRKQPAVGILLLDPTIKEGLPLWRGYRNWEPPPSMYDPKPPPPGPPNTSLFEDVIFWTMKPYFASPNPAEYTSSNPILPIQGFLHLVCAEWFTMISYLSTRLGQLEWEISFPADFLLEDAADSSLKKLHVWRRLVPLYREMLTEALERVFRFPPFCPSNATTATDSAADASEVVRHIATLLEDKHRKTFPPDPTESNEALHLDSDDILSRAGTLFEQPHRSPAPAFHALRPSYAQALSRMNELQQRLNRLSTIATSAITIAESRLSYAENRNVSRLTWLATIFIPLTFITGLFSIQPDIPQLKSSFGYFFAVAVPLAAIVMGAAAVTRWLGKERVGKEKKKKPGQFVFYGRERRKKGLLRGT